MNRQADKTPISSANSDGAFLSAATALLAVVAFFIVVISISATVALISAMFSKRFWFIVGVALVFAIMVMIT
jgi:hypothetical protein